MKRTTRIIVMLLALLFLLAPAAIANESGSGRLPLLKFNQTAVATENLPPQHPETPMEVLEQVAAMFSDDSGLAIGESAALFLLCNRLDSADDPDYLPERPGNIGIGLKIKF